MGHASHKSAVARAQPPPGMRVSIFETRGQPRFFAARDAAPALDFIVSVRAAMGWQARRGLPFMLSWASVPSSSIIDQSDDSEFAPESLASLATTDK